MKKIFLSIAMLILSSPTYALARGRGHAFAGEPVSSSSVEMIAEVLMWLLLLIAILFFLGLLVTIFKRPKKIYKWLDKIM